MAYNLKDVFYLSAQHEYPHGTYGSAGIEGAIPLDVSAYVDPISKGRAKGQGLAIYKVHCHVAADTTGTSQIATDEGAANFGLTVKPFTLSGDNISELGSPDLSCASDLAIYLAQFTSPASRLSGSTNVGNAQDAVSYLCLPKRSMFSFEPLKDWVINPCTCFIFLLFNIECLLSHSIKFRISTLFSTAIMISYHFITPV